MRKNDTNEGSLKAFTLIELLVVVAVLALLASIVFSNLGGAREGAKISNALSFQSQTHSLLGSDLVGWWNFNDSSNRYKDLSGSGNNISCTSCPTAIDGVPGTGGTAMNFDGLGNYLDMPIFYLGNTNWTVSSWVKTNSTTEKSLISNSSGGPVHNLLGINASKILYRHYDGVWKYKYGTSNISDDNWHYLIWANHSNETIDLYVDGIRETAGAASTTNNNGPVNRLGGGWSSTYLWAGDIDDVRIYSRALTASEVQGLYAQTKGNYLADGN